MCLLTFGKLVKVNVEAQHEGAADEAEGRADGGDGEEDAWETKILQKYFSIFLFHSVLFFSKYIHNLYCY